MLENIHQARDSAHLEKNDAYFMQKAIGLAQKGIGYVNPNPLVGAVVTWTDDEQNTLIIGQGYHQYYGGPHAEVYAIDEAVAYQKNHPELSISLDTASIYVTLEPCSHTGLTPPCAKKIIPHKFARCIIASLDPNPQVAGRGLALLEAAGIAVTLGVCQQEAMQLNRVFFHYITQHKAYLFLKTAITLDGKIATHNGDSKWISNDLAREKVQWLRHRYSAIMVGIQTVIKDDPALLNRQASYTHPVRIVLDSALRIPLDARVLQQKSAEKTRTIIITSQKMADSDQHHKLSDLGAEFIFLAGNRFLWHDMLTALAAHKIDSVLLEGGASLISQAFEQDAVQEGMIFIAPKIVGDGDAIAFISGRKAHSIDDSLNLKNVKYQNYNDNICLEFYQGEDAICLQD